MPNRSSKRPRDVNALAKLIADVATGQVELPKTDDGKDPAAVALGRKGGLKGGKARAASLSPKKRRAIAKVAAKARWQKHTQAGEWASEVVTLLESLPSELDPGIKTERDNIFSLDPFRLSDIPDTLVEELKISRADKMDAQVMELFRIAQRPLNISEVLVGLYRKFDVTEKRPALSARLYRLTQADQLESSEGARGTYQLVQKQKPAGKAGFQVSEAT